MINLSKATFFTIDVVFVISEETKDKYSQIFTARYNINQSLNIILDYLYKLFGANIFNNISQHLNPYRNHYNNTITYLIIISTSRN